MENEISVQFSSVHPLPEEKHMPLSPDLGVSLVSRQDLCAFRFSPVIFQLGLLEVVILGGFGLFLEDLG